MPLAFDFARSEILLMGTPVCLISREFFVDLQAQLEAVLGKAARGALYRAAFSAGSRAGSAVGGVLPPGGDVDGTLRQLAQFLAIAGYGSAEVRSLDWGRRETEWVMHGSFLAAMHSPSRESVCHLVAGFLAGTLSTLTGEPLEAVEAECVAKGDARCVFRTRRAAASPI
jgi:predicted hydrocarbon binding protein